MFIYALTDAWKYDQNINILLHVSDTFTFMLIEIANLLQWV